MGPFKGSLGLNIEKPLNIFFYRTNGWIITKLCLFVCLDFTARQHINGHIVPNAKIGLNDYVKRCKKIKKSQSDL
jgi:hypothetical protein